MVLCTGRSCTVSFTGRIHIVPCTGRKETHGPQDAHGPLHGKEGMHGKDTQGHMHGKDAHGPVHRK